MAKRGSLRFLVTGTLMGMSLMLTSCGMESIDTIMQYISINDQYEAEEEQIGKLVTKDEIDQEITNRAKVSLEDEENISSETVLCTYAYDQLDEASQLWYQDIKRILENMELDQELSRTIQINHVRIKSFAARLAREHATHSSRYENMEACCFGSILF